MPPHLIVRLGVARMRLLKAIVRLGVAWTKLLGAIFRWE